MSNSFSNVGIAVNGSTGVTIGNTEIKGSFTQQQGEDLAKVLEAISGLVSQSQNVQATALFEQFQQELKKEKPEKGILQNILEAMGKIIPMIKPLADIFSLFPF